MSQKSVEASEPMRLSLSKIINVSGKEYYSVDELLEVYPCMFYQCENPRGLVIKHDIPKKSYMFAKQSEGFWVETTATNMKSGKLLVSKIWTDEQTKTLEPLPPLIKLNEKERFRDDDNKIIYVEVRGCRTHEGCYFKAKDIEEGFQMANVKNKIMKLRNGFKENEHFKYFAIKNTNKKGYCVKRTPFLTHKGLLKLLTTSAKGKFKKYLDWISNTLFTIQFGSDEQKTELVSKIKGVPLETVASVFDETTTETPCIYLIRLGRANDLCEKMGLSGIDRMGKPYKDDVMIYKYGRSCNYAQRMKAHIRDFKKQGITGITSAYYVYLDPLHVNKAEQKLEKFIIALGCHLEAMGHRELAILSDKRLKDIKERFDELREQYCGHTGSITRENQELKLQITNYKNKISYLESTVEYLDRNIECLNKQNTFLNTNMTNMTNIINMLASGTINNRTKSTIEDVVKKGLKKIKKT